MNIANVSLNEVKSRLYSIIGTEKKLKDWFLYKNYIVFLAYRTRWHYAIYDFKNNKCILRETAEWDNLRSELPKLDILGEQIPINESVADSNDAKQILSTLLLFKKLSNDAKARYVKRMDKFKDSKGEEFKEIYKFFIDSYDESEF